LNYELNQISNTNILDEQSFTNKQIANTTENNYEVACEKKRDANRLEVAKYSLFKEMKTDLHK
jgi:hypothetical protein